jgi:hypothetical protein
LHGRHYSRDHGVGCPTPLVARVLKDVENRLPEAAFRDPWHMAWLYATRHNLAKLGWTICAKQEREENAGRIIFLPCNPGDAVCLSLWAVTS